MNEANKALVRRYYDEAMSDLSGIEELVTSDFVDHHYPPEIPPGPDGVRHFFQELLGGIFDDMKIDIDFLLAEDDRVDCHFTVHAKHTGEFAGVAPKGNDIHCPAISTFRIEDGKLAEAWEIYDSGDLLRQMEA